MKKKILIGAIGLASVFMLASATDGGETERRPMFGQTVTSNGDCHPSSSGGGQATGEATCECPVIVTTYVFWVAFETESVRYTPC
ncbi:hypothetical protein ASG22_07860 [Chryseobacterium sp. Leaf405]|uniref:hypothetical protein n=1 Tax=Chryseobacterium sp. Leaf405 TaxID=1736367 RepID=UPI00070117C4|nr:hypothetical protein [Chryseobacterium sp. Leaf405]KQT23933.1 hypothetical protein ASG22_07860 [Chryseobacterium sp. Leaf405]